MCIENYPKMQVNVITQDIVGQTNCREFVAGTELLVK